jgi:cobalt-zinc-cadmium efflux system membrane fusion protein
VAQERLALLGAQPDSAQKVVDSSKLDPLVIVRAPRSGLVIERNVNPGELNDGTKQLFTLANLSEVWLIANIFERDVEDVHKGQKAVVSLDSLPNHPFPANIVWVGDSVSPTTRTLPVRANVANADFILKPNMFARIKVNAGQVSTLLVPRGAVVEKGDTTMVYVETGAGVYTERTVVTAAKDDKDIQITRGLAPGERVVSKGATALLGATMRRTAGND